MSVNDNFTNRTFFSGLPKSIAGSNIGDTGEVGEPAQSGPINSAWWSWTAPSTGTVTFSTINSNFDTYLSVFTGSALNNLTLIGADDNSGGNNTSLLTRSVTAGTTYQIAVDGYQANTGLINLNITAPPPANNNFANAIALTGATANSTGSNHGATEEIGEPAQSGQINSVWWSWTAPSSGIFTIDTQGSNFDTYLYVYTGSALNNLSLIRSDDDAGEGLTSLINLNATAGTTYKIAVDGYGNNSLGSINLNIAPNNDNDYFANRIALTGETATATGSNIGDTGEVGEPAQSGTINSAWWSWTAPSSGTFTIDTQGSNFDTYLYVYTGSALNNLTQIASDDDAGEGLTSLINLNATAGTTYQIAVDGYQNNTGQIQLNIAPSLPRPAGAGNLTGTANADTINGVPDSIAGKPANNTVKGETAEDPLTGGPAADTLMLPFAESSVSPSVPGTDFAGSKKTDLLIDGGAMMNAPSLFSPDDNSAVPTLVKDVNPVFTEANGALVGTQPLGMNGDPFDVAKTSLFPDPYLVGNYPAKPLGIEVA
jgi:hypothetical protein